MSKQNSKLNWPLVGNAHITEFIEKLILKDEVSGTYIFSGPDNLGKTTTAIYFAQILLCQNKQNGKVLPCGECSICRHFSEQRNQESSVASGETGQDEMLYAHGDFHLIKKEKDKKNIGIEQIRDFIRTLNLSSFLDSYKIGIIKHADSLSNEASNALLKTLEEPKEKVIIILISADIGQIHSTIVSRSKVLNFHPVPTEEIYDYLLKDLKKSRSEAKSYSRLALGRPALAVKFLEDREFNQKYQEKMNIFINFFSQDINSRLLAVDQLFDKKVAGQELVKKTKRTLEVWQGIIRDFLLIECGQDNLMQHVIVEDKIKQAGRGIAASRLLNCSTLIQRSKIMLEANVNPKLVLDNIAINL